MSEEIENLRKEAGQLLEGEKWGKLILVSTNLIYLEEEPHNQAVAYYDGNKP